MGLVIGVEGFRVLKEFKVFQELWVPLDLRDRKVLKEFKVFQELMELWVPLGPKGHKAFRGTTEL
jgi:hypothetical protein